MKNLSEFNKLMTSIKVGDMIEYHDFSLNYGMRKYNGDSVTQMRVASIFRPNQFMDFATFQSVYDLSADEYPALCRVNAWRFVVQSLDMTQSVVLSIVYDAWASDMQDITVTGYSSLDEPLYMDYFGTGFPIQTPQPLQKPVQPLVTDVSQLVDKRYT